MSTERTKRKVRGKDADETVSSGVPSGTSVGLGGQKPFKEDGGKRTAQVPVWSDNSVPRGIGVPPAKPPKPKPS